MAINTKDKLEQKIQRSLSWRRKEITSLFFLASSEFQEGKDVLAKSFVCLLYSHYEGFVKDVFLFLLEYFNYNNLNYSDFVKSFIYFEIRKELLGGVPKKTSPIWRFSNKFCTIENRKFNCDPISTIDMESNLNSELLDSLFKIFSIDSSTIELKYNFIDEVLLSQRNKIAHGNYVKIDEIDIHSSHDIIKDFFDKFTDLIIDYVSNEKFRCAI